MGERKVSEFNKVLGIWEILVMAFGAMIGWGWVVYSGEWITKGGVLGAMLGFVIGGIMIYFVGLTYAELTAAMPQSGGEHVFSYKAMGPIGSFICTWSIILGYIGVVCFETVALPTIIAYIYPDFLQGYMYTVAGFDIYLSWLVTGIVIAILITAVNIKGVKEAAMMQTALTIIIGMAGVLLIAGAAINGSVDNLTPQMFVGETSTDIMWSVLGVAMVAPFFFIGFDVIPQAAEEISVPLKKIGTILVLSIILAVAFYALVILAAGLALNPTMLKATMEQNGLVSAIAMEQVFNSSIMAKVLVLGGICGILTSWNSFLIGGSRAIYAMAESYMVPTIFKKIHPTYKTPINALILIGILSVLSPFFGRKMLVWAVDAANFACCWAYCMVSISFLILRKKEKTMHRPYKVAYPRLVGTLAVVLSGIIVVMYVVPGSPAALVTQEWYMVGGWALLGAGFAAYGKFHYGDDFASHIDVPTETNTAHEGIQMAMDRAIETVKAPTVTETIETTSFTFSYFLPVNINFGWGKVGSVGELTKPYGNKALIVTGRSSAKKSGLYDLVKDSLAISGISSVLFDEVEANPLTTTAEKGACKAREEACDVVVAIGGGSVLDCAKAIAFLAKNDGNINDYIYGKLTSNVALPSVVIPTTCGTGSESNGFAVLTNSETGDKKSLRCNAIVPKVSIVDPAVMMTMPKYVLASVGFDALCHNIEAYTAKAAQPFTDALAIYAIDLLANHLVKIYEGSDSKESWEAVTLASTIGGMVINIAGVTLAHGMEHPASGLKDVVHGNGLAALEPIAIEASLKGNFFKFGKIARVLGGLTADDCAPKVRGLLKQLDLNVSLGTLGITEADIPWMAKNCMKVGAGNIANNPVAFTEVEIAELYRRAL